MEIPLVEVTSKLETPNYGELLIKRMVSVEDYFKVQSYPYETDDVAGKSLKLEATKEEEALTFVEELNTKLLLVHPQFAEKIALLSPILFNLMRSVKDETKQDYKGARARGQELDIVMFGPEELGKTTWTQTFAATGWADFIATIAAPRDMTQYSAELIIGFIDRIASPKVNKVRFVKNGDPYVVENLDFDFVKDDQVYPVHILRQPWIAFPRDKYAVRQRAFATGTDRLIPVGFKVVRAESRLVES